MKNTDEKCTERESARVSLKIIRIRMNGGRGGGEKCVADLVIDDDNLEID